jgi:hypothetical protein
LSWWPAAVCGEDERGHGDSGPPGLRAWAEEDEGVRADLVAVSAGRGEARNGGEEELCGG